MTTPVPTRYMSSHEGPTYSINSFIKKPALIQEVMFSMLRNQFIGEWLFRKGPSAASGAVAWRDPGPMYALDDIEVVAEFGEIPVAEFGGPLLHARATTKRGLGVTISEEMRDRNDVNTLRERIESVKNTTIRGWDRLAHSLIFNNGDIEVISAGTDWYSSSSTIRRDIADASYFITSARDDTHNELFGFKPDTLLINHMTVSEMIASDEVNEVFKSSPLSPQAPQYTGVLPKKFFGLDVVASWDVPDGDAVVMQRKKVGFISDERPLRVTPMYEDKPREMFRSDVTRRSVMVVDNPKALVIIRGIDAA